MSDRKKPGVVFWATWGLAVALVGYPLSWGPAYSLLWRWYNDGSAPEWALKCIAIYLQPMQLALDCSPVWIKQALEWYLELWFP